MSDSDIIVCASCGAANVLTAEQLDAIEEEARTVNPEGLDAARSAPLDVDEPTDAQIVAAWNEASKADWYATDSWTEHVARGRAFLAALRATPLAGAASDEEGGA